MNEIRFKSVVEGEKCAAFFSGEISKEEIDKFLNVLHFPTDIVYAGDDKIVVSCPAEHKWDIKMEAGEMFNGRLEYC